MTMRPRPSQPSEAQAPLPEPGDDEERGHHEVAEYALLGLLRAGPAHGYRLSAAFEPEGRLGQILHLKMSLMYAYLRKLERQGWVHARTEATDSVRTRRVFTLTPEGERTFDRWVAEPVGAMREVRLDFMVKLAFAIEQDRTQAAALVTHQEQAVRRWLERLRAQAGGLDEQQRVSVLGLVLGHRIRQSEATLTWLADVRGRITRTT